jgi:hypothetical protein
LGTGCTRKTDENGQRKQHKAKKYSLFHSPILLLNDLEKVTFNIAKNKFIVNV